MRLASSAANTFCHSCCTSLMVALASFITVWAEDGSGAAVARKAAAAGISRREARRRFTAVLPRLAWLYGSHCVGEDQRKSRPVSDDEKGDDLHHDEREHAAIDGLERDAEHRLRDEHVEPERRREHADREIDGHHDAEVD